MQASNKQTIVCMCWVTVCINEQTRAGTWVRLDIKAHRWTWRSNSLPRLRKAWRAQKTSNAVDPCHNEGAGVGGGGHTARHTARHTALHKTPHRATQPRHGATRRDGRVEYFQSVVAACVAPPSGAGEAIIAEARRGQAETETTVGSRGQVRAHGAGTKRRNIGPKGPPQYTKA